MVPFSHLYRPNLMREKQTQRVRIPPRGMMEGWREGQVCRQQAGLDWNPGSPDSQFCDLGRIQLPQGSLSSAFKCYKMGIPHRHDAREKR